MYTENKAIIYSSDEWTDHLTIENWNLIKMIYDLQIWMFALLYIQQTIFTKSGDNSYHRSKNREILSVRLLTSWLQYFSIIYRRSIVATDAVSFRRRKDSFSMDHKWKRRVMMDSSLVRKLLSPPTSSWEPAKFQVDGSAIFLLFFTPTLLRDSTTSSCGSAERFLESMRQKCSNGAVSAKARVGTDPGRTRTCSLRFRRATPCPLGHRAMLYEFRLLFSLRLRERPECGAVGQSIFVEDCGGGGLMKLARNFN